VIDTAMHLAKWGFLAVAVWAAYANVAMAQSVTLAGMLGTRALVIVDGSPPKSVAVGESHKGVKVISTDGDTAVVEVAGRKQTLRVGEAPANVGFSGGPGSAGGNKIVMSIGRGGHFFKQGQINGKSVDLMVDTGATAVAMSADEARRIGLDYSGGRKVSVGTANGTTQGWVVTLSSVRIGDVEVSNVQGVVSPGSMPYVLLGNSFLNRFEMTRTGEQMVLLKRY
jgi:aspartyl protease family protein